MILAVESYDRVTDSYLCSDESGRKHRVDLLVDGGLSSTEADADREWLIGRTVECDCLIPWIEIAMTTRIMEQKA